MQDIYYPETDQIFLTMKETFYGITLAPKKYQLYMCLKTNDSLKKIPIFYKNKVHFVDTLSRRTYFWDTAVPCGSENSHNVVQQNPDKDKNYLLTPYPTLMQPLEKFFFPESNKTIARNPNIDLQSIGVYSKSDIQHHIRTQQFQELLKKMDTKQRQSLDQNLR